ncbi:MAG: mechanosensitive ion channel [Kiloniellales bacterium]|nr:mechanosensitive ion channel [Kiloniellales bacterium]
MELPFDLATLQPLLDSALNWADNNILSWRVAFQVLLLAAAYLAARLIGRRLAPLVQRRLDSLQRAARVRPLLRVLARLLVPLIFLALLWLVTGLLRQLTWPSFSYLLEIALSLATAWVVIRASASLIRNPVMSKTIAVIVWTIAALSITELLDPTVALLDSLAVTLGELRISALLVIEGVISLAVLLWGALALSAFLERHIKGWSDLTPSVQVLLGKLLKIALLTVAFLIALHGVGIDLTALAVFSGAVGLGLGFGLQKVVSNLISGIILLLDKSIKPGDVIELGPTFGWIHSLGARYVSVVTRDGKEYLIPNEDLITQPVVNWSYSDQLVRMEATFGVDYASDPHQVRRVAVEAARKVERVLGEPAPVCHLSAFGDSSIEFLLRFWITDPEAGSANVTGQVLLQVWDAFKAEGIAFAYPHRQLVLPQPIRIETAPAA